MSTPQTQIPDFDTFVRERGTTAAPSRSPLPARAAQPRSQLPPVDPRLDSFANDLIGEASKRTGYTYKLGEGSRTPEQQAGKVAAGYSKTYNSKHLSGRGRDINAFDSSGAYIADGSHDAYKMLGAVAHEKAPGLPFRVKWGGDFKDFYDPSHFEIDDDDAPAPAVAPSAEPPDFDTFVASRNVPDFDEFVKQRAQDAGEEVVSTEAAVEGATGKTLALNDPRRRQRPDASTVQIQSPSSYLKAPSPTPRPNVRTMEGRVERDAHAALERKPGARIEVVVPVADIASADAPQLVRDAYRRAAVARGVPAEFFDRWAEKDSGGFYLHNLQGDELTAADAYDDDAKGVRLSLDVERISRVVDDYKASRGTLKKFSDWASSDETSPGEKFVDVASAGAAAAAPVVKASARGLDLATRPLQAVDAAFWAKVRGASDVQSLVIAYQQFFGDNPGLGKNVIAEALRNSEGLRRVNPRLPALLGELSNMILQPSNLIPVGVLGRAAQTGNLARAGEVLTEAGRGLRLLHRGMVEARPLGLLEEGQNVLGRVAADAPDDLLRAAGYKVERVAAPNVSAEDALYSRAVAEVRGKAGEGTPFLLRPGQRVSDDDTARLLARMEREGIVSPADERGFRTVLDASSPVGADREVWKVVGPDGNAQIMRADAELADFADYLGGRASQNVLTPDPAVPGFGKTVDEAGLLRTRRWRTQGGQQGYTARPGERAAHPQGFGGFECSAQAGRDLHADRATRRRPGDERATPRHG